MRRAQGKKQIIAGQQPNHNARARNLSSCDATPRAVHRNRARCNDAILKPGFDLASVAPHDGGKLGDETCA